MRLDRFLFFIRLAKSRTLAQRIVTEGRGVVVYLRGHEGRGIGLLAKLSAYELQDAGADTVEAQTRLGLPIDAREYGAAAAILRDLGAENIVVLTNNPEKSESLVEAGFTDVTTRPLHAGVNPDNLRYLRTKADRMRHAITEDDLDVDPAVVRPGPIENDQRKELS